MGDRINRRNFLELDGFTFSFKMTHHLNPLIPVEKILTAICEKISHYHQLTFPKWTRLQEDYRLVRITAENDLFQYLDVNSKQKMLNWLIFSRKGNKIVVTHFGPFGEIKDNNFEAKVNETMRNLEKLEVDWIEVENSLLPQEEKEAKLIDIHVEIKAHYLRVAIAIEEQIEAKKRQLRTITETVFDSEEGRLIKQALDKITPDAGWIMFRYIAKELVMEITLKIARMVAKQTTKQGAKIASKAAAKTTSKGIPGFGLVVGTGFAIWSLMKGDGVGAGLEFASGVASCVPGAGTVASMAFDAYRMTNDVNNALREAAEILGKMVALKATTERIERELNALFEKWEKAKAEYDFVRKVLGDRGYDFDKLKHDIKVVKEVSRELHNK